jgi:hypothetical protein
MEVGNSLLIEFGLDEVCEGNGIHRLAWDKGGAAMAWQIEGDDRQNLR